MADLNALAADVEDAADTRRSAREALDSAAVETLQPLKEALREAETAERQARAVFDRGVQDVRTRR